MVENKLQGQVLSGTGKFGVFCQLVKGNSHADKGCTARNPKKNPNERLRVLFVGLGLSVVDILMAKSLINFTWTLP